nr:translocation/assembly module TamB domain-containing protein [Oleiagrimonas soli]
MLLVAGLALGWLLGTASGLRFALARAEHFTGDALQVQQAQGRLAGPLTLTGVRYRDRQSGLDVQIARVQLDLRPFALLAGRAHLLQLDVRDVDVALPTRPSASASDTGGTLTLRAPFNVVLDQAHIGHVRVHQGAQDVFVSDRLDLSGAWTHDGLQLRRLQLRAPDGQADLDGAMAFGGGYPGKGTLHFDWKAADKRWAGTLTADNNGRRASASIDLTQPSAAHVHLTLAPRSPYTWQARIELPRGDAAPWIGAGSVQQMAASLDAHGDLRTVQASGTLELDATRVQLAALTAHADKNGKQWLLDRLRITSPQHQGVLQGHGSIRLDPTPLTAALDLQWSDVTLPATLVGQTLASQGQLHFDGNAERYQATLDAQAGPPGKPSHLTATLHGTAERATIETFAIQQPKGKLEAHGELQWTPQLQWQFDAQATRFDPGALLAGWNGALDAKLSTQGLIADQGTHATLQLDRLEGTLRQRPVSGKGTLKLSAAKVLSGTLQLRSGSGDMQLDGKDGARNDLDVRLRIASLGDWLPQARGALNGQFRVRGLWPKLGVRGNLDGAKLAWNDQRAEQLHLNVDVDDLSHPGGTLTLNAQQVEAAGFAFATLSVDGRGNRQRHALRVAAKGDPLSLQLALSGGMQGDAWKGSLDRLDLGLEGIPEWRLRAPAALAWNRGEGSLGQTCLSPGQPELCMSAERKRDGSLRAQYRMRELPLEMILAVAGNDLPMRADGTLSGDGDIRRDAKGHLDGQARLQSAQGQVFYVDHPNQPLIRFRGLDANLAMTPQEQRLRIGASLQQNGRLDGDLRMQGPQHALSGQLHMHLDNLRFVELFSSEVANLQGDLKADLALAGTLAAPAASGEAVVDGFSGEIPGLGLKLSQGQVRVSGSNAQQLRIDGRVHSGDGDLNIAGTLGLGSGGGTDIKLTGSKVQVADIPSAMVSISPDLAVTHDANGLHIGGTLGVDKANVKLEKLPGAGTTQASPDVVVVDAEKPPQEAGAALAVSTDVRIDLGRHTHVVGYGLDGDLRGNLHVIGRSGKGALGQGQIRVDGTFRAYGQDLHIEQGRLLFASTPLDDPGLDIRAVRKLNPNATVDDGQVVGLQVRGTAKRPELTVFSNPVMEQSDALSYLITGKPLSQVKGGEGSMVNSAAQALGSATGDLLAKGIGSKLGISDIGVSSNDALGTAAFTVGKYLSPRLYLSYGVGLFQPGQVVTLRYILSRRWNFEAQQATEFSRASFNYRYER